MKKLIALLIALMVLALPIASAETVVIADPVISADGQTIDLTGLEIAVGIGTVGETLAAQIDFNGNGQKLYGIAVNAAGDRVLIAPEGVSSVYYAAIPSEVAGLAEMQMPDIDLDGILETLMGSIEMDGNVIRIPYTAINEALAQLAPQLEGVQIPGVDTADIINTLTQLKDGDSGITLELTYDESDAGTAINAKGLLVQGGEVSGQEAFNMALTMGEDVNFTIDLMGEATIYFATAGNKITLGGSADGSAFELSFVVSTSDAEAALTEIDGSNAIDVTTLGEDELSALGNELMTAAGSLLMFVVGALGMAA